MRGDCINESIAPGPCAVKQKSGFAKIIIARISGRVYITVSGGTE